MSFTLTLRLALVLAGANLLSFSASAQIFSLKNLKSNKVEVINPVGVPSIVMVFQPQCNWCKKQANELSELLNECSAPIHLSLVGTLGRNNQLKSELKHYPKSIPAFKATTRFLRKIGGFQASPTTLFFNSKGQPLSKRKGYIQKDKALRAMILLTKGGCDELIAFVQY